MPPPDWRDVEVALALAALLELGRAIAAEDEVGVRVDQAGPDEAAARVELFGVRSDQPGGNVGLGADPR